jgi:hypothetical protein
MASPSIPYTTLNAIAATLGLDVVDVPNFVTNNTSLSVLVTAGLLVKIPNHESLSGSDTGTTLLKAWATFYGALQLTVLAPSMFLQSSTFEGHTETVGKADVAVIRDHIQSQLQEIEAAIKSQGVVSGQISYGLMGRASPAYDPITGV